MSEWSDVNAPGHFADRRFNPDRRDGLAYVVRDDLELAVEVALATGRPLLLRGHPGSGKSSFAAYVARQRGWRYYEHVVTSTTEAHDLLWTFDHVRRLADAQAQRLNGDDAYLRPGALWRAFSPETARHHAGNGPRVAARFDDNKGRSPKAAVVLVDEIDKADPDLPNALLVPLGSRQFTVEPTGQAVAPEPESIQLIVITTNEQRELPAAFLRRCVVVTLSHPTDNQLVDIAVRHLEAHGDTVTPETRTLAETLAQIVVKLRDEPGRTDGRKPSTAEFLDAFYACRELQIVPRGPRWDALRSMLLVKPVGEV